MTKLGTGICKPLYDPSKHNSLVHKIPPTKEKLNIIEEKIRKTGKIKNFAEISNFNLVESIR